MKKYEEILEEKKSGKKETGLVKFDMNALVKADSVETALALAESFVPEFQKNSLVHAPGLPEERKEKWLATIDEAVHSINTLQHRRTITEKTLAVLQSNRHPTAGAKFHQAKLEQAVFTEQLMDQTLEYEKNKIRLEKMMYKFQKKKEHIESEKDKGRDTFLLEKDLELYKISLAKKMMDLKGMEKSLQNKREEVIEWSDIKDELYKEATAKGEIWSPDEVDGEMRYQELPLVLRHFQNFLIQIQNPDGNDISSVLNIQGLCQTAFQEGIRTGKLGLFMAPLSDAQIALIWGRLYGVECKVQRSDDGYIAFVLPDNRVLTYPSTHATMREFLDRQKEQKKDD